MINKLFTFDLIIAFFNIFISTIILKGISNIENIYKNEEAFIKYNESDGDIVQDLKESVLYTTGINYEKIKYIKGIDLSRTTCNDVNTILRLYGIEAARNILSYELSTVFESNNSVINNTHISLLVDQMCFLGDIISIDRHGLNKIESEPLSKVSFEQQMDHFINAARYNETDNITSVSSRVALGRVINGVTGAFNLILDTERIHNSEYIENEFINNTKIKMIEAPLIKDAVKYNEVNKKDFFIP